MWTALLACAETECTEGFDAGPDGLCYATEQPVAPGYSPEPAPPQATPIEAGTEAWPACIPTEGDGSLDLVAGCVSGLCLGDTYAEAVRIVGPATDTWLGDPGWVYQYWNEGWGAWYLDLDLDGAPDADAPADALSIYPTADQTTDDGLGTDVPLRCFLDALGPPESWEVTDQLAGWTITAVTWSFPDLRVTDSLAEGQLGLSDGLADFLYFGWPGGP